jgi:hypothetical protein
MPQQASSSGTLCTGTGVAYCSGHAMHFGFLWRDRGAGALTALALQGFTYYVRLGKQTVYLFSPIKTRLPAWFRKYDWPQLIVNERTSFLPNEIGISDL